MVGPAHPEGAGVTPLCSTCHGECCVNKRGSVVDHGSALAWHSCLDCSDGFAPGVTDTEARARRAERAEIVAWLRTEAARYRGLEPVLSPAARALEATAYLIETHAPHAVDLPEPGRHGARERGNNER